VSGPKSQQTGHAGAKLVEAVLTVGGFVCGGFDPDLGEDLWIEAQGYEAAAQGSFPLRALVQVKSSEKSDATTFPYDLETKHIRRWAAQPQPVFVIGVALGEPPRFYAKYIDTILTEDLGGQDPMRVTAQTTRVHLPLVPDLPGYLKHEITAHYRASQLILERIPEETIEHEYFEMLDRKAPEAWAKIPIASWTVYWKSPRRPQHLAAVLTELARRAQVEYTKSIPQPAFVVFHIYRSLLDVQRNLATFRVDWVDPSHPKAPDIQRILGAPGGFRMRRDKGVDDTREFFRSRTATPEDFAAYAQTLGAIFDVIADQIMANPSAEVWTPSLTDAFRQAEKLWDDGPFAPTEYAQLERALTAEHDALFEHYYVAIYRRDKLPPVTVTRLLDQSAARLRDYRGAWRLFVVTR